MKYTNPRFQRALFGLLLRLQRRHKSEDGYILVIVMAMVVALGTMLITAAITSKVDSNNTRASSNSATGFYAAEAGLNLRAKAIRTTFNGYNRPAGTSPTDWIACRPVDPVGTVGDGEFNCRTNTFQGQPVATFVAEDPTNPTSITINRNELFGGLNAQEYRYDVNSVAFDKENQPTASLQMRFKSRLVPLFQFAAFYDKDLEILPGPDMTLSGPVHTNGDLYLNADNTLTINGQISTVGNLYRRRKNNTDCGGTVNASSSSSTSATATMACSGQITDVTAWNSQIRLNIPRVDVPPVETFSAVAGNTYWDKADLRLVLKLDNTTGNPNSIEVWNFTGVDSSRTNLLNSCSGGSSDVSTTLTSAVTNSSSTTISVNSTTGFSVGDFISVGSDFDSNVIASIDTSSKTLTLERQLGSTASSGDAVRKIIVSTSDTMYNFREGKAIRMLNVDVRSLLDCAKRNSLLDDSKLLDDSTEGGLVWHLTVNGPNSGVNIPGGDTVGNNYGVRLYNGARLDSTISGAPTVRGLTVVSDQAIYVRGDYNCVWNTTSSACDNKKPAAIMSDSLNVLSNNWNMNDFASCNVTAATPANGGCAKATYPAPTASETRVNAAFLAGTDSTGGVEGVAGQDRNIYNGGLENYPRFHENWSGFTLRYRGSFVSLNQPLRVNGRWDDQNYSPPSRDWNYDTDFNNAANLPPISPRFVYLRQERFSREFQRTSALPLLSVPFVSFFPTNLFATLPTAIGGRFIF
jgi:hypothetical protein